MSTMRASCSHCAHLHSYSGFRIPYLHGFILRINAYAYNAYSWKGTIMRLVNAKIDDIIRELQFIRKEYGNLPMKDDVTINLDTMPMKVKEGQYRNKPAVSIGVKHE